MAKETFFCTMNQLNKNLKTLIKKLKQSKEANSFNYRINKNDFDIIQKNYTFIEENENGK